MRVELEVAAVREPLVLVALVDKVMLMMLSFNSSEDFFFHSEISVLVIFMRLECTKLSYVGHVNNKNSQLQSLCC